MCDTFVALTPATQDNSIILGKNADCRVNEAHVLVRFPGKKHPPGAVFRASHIAIPQAEETYEVIMGKSFWTWGCELGINEHGLAMGNEAVFSSNIHDEKLDGLTVIDLMRIGLERARTCREAIEVMGTALETFGQGGNCELPGNSHWDASFMMADTREAWILETAGREWAAKQVDPIASISNVLSIHKDWDMCSAEQKGDDFDWFETFGNIDPIPGSHQRQACTIQGLQASQGQINVLTAFKILRDHGENFVLERGDAPDFVCMHPGADDNRLWIAVGAMVSEVSIDGAIAWFTGTSGTCLSIFKPIFPGIELPDIGPAPTDQYDPHSLWWKHETMHRRVMPDFRNLQPEIREDFDALEEQFVEHAKTVIKGSNKEKKQFMDSCFQEALEATEKWIERLEKMNLKFADRDYAAAWKVFNREAGLADMPA